MYKMPAEDLRKWLKGLRSGNYFQTQGRYRQPDNDVICYHCAIGVALDVKGVFWNNGIATYIEIEDWNEEDRIYFEAYESVHPVLGMSEDLWEIVVDMNDDQGLTFTEIADWLEDNVKGV